MRTFLTLVFLACAAAPGWAAVEPHEVVEQTADDMLSALRENRSLLEEEPERLYGLVNEIVIPRFDFRSMSQLVLGRYWRSATDAERERFVHEFRTLLVRSYATTLLEYADERFRVFPTRDAGSNVTVRSEVTVQGGSPIAINYQMHNRNDQWKVFDVTVDGVSLVTTWNGEFSSQIRKEGIDALIRKLAERNAGSGA